VSQFRVSSFEFRVSDTLMMRLIFCCFAFALLCLSAEAAFSQSSYTPVTKYDPKRDAARDIDDAVAEARRSSRRILLVVGGEWCSWCHTLEDYFSSHPELKALREKNFVTVKINYSDENRNEAVLSRYGPIEGYPHIFVLESDGKLIHSQETGVLESGRSYDLEKVSTFLTRWAPAAK
jgi:thioredoxin-related protein